MLQISPCYSTFFLRLNTLSTAESRLNEPMFIESNREKSLKLIAHFSVGVGTIVWAYGDLLFKPI